MADRRITSRTKVYITRIGLRDWVVAVDSQKAALKAWDVHRNLFAEGAARVTIDPVHVELAMRTPGVPVAAPGRVVESENAPAPARRGKTKPQPTPSNVVRFPGERRRALAASPKVQPDRSKLDAAERELRAYERDVVRERAAIEKRLRTVQTELEAFDAEAARRRGRLEKRVAREKAALDG